jgi:hypothetical protein
MQLQARFESDPEFSQFFAKKNNVDQYNFAVIAWDEESVYM